MLKDLMKKTVALLLGLGILAGVTPAAYSSPEDDKKTFQGFFMKKFPQLKLQDFADGLYAIDPVSRASWEQMEEFPPYAVNIEEGQKLFGTPFANGKSYADCFENKGVAIKQNYPYFDAKTGKVKTLEQEINECREKNGEKPLPGGKGAIASIEAYMASTSRGKMMDTKITDDPRALAAYEAGKKFYWTKRGQFNFACADCHVQNSGALLRTEILSPALGHVTHFPVYRSNGGELITLHMRYKGCNELVRAKAFDFQSDEYRNLEYYMSYTNNGLMMNGPASRR